MQESELPPDEGQESAATGESMGALGVLGFLPTEWSLQNLANIGDFFL